MLFRSSTVNKIPWRRIVAALIVLAALVTAVLTWNYLLRKKIAQATVDLREREETFRALSENSRDVIMRFDRRGRHLYVNPMARQLTGIPSEKFLGKTHAELGFPPDLCARWEAVIQKVFATKEVGRTEFQLPTGIWIDWLLMPEMDERGKVQAVITSARDVTDRKKAEEEVRNSELLFRNLFEQHAVIELILDPDSGKILDANASAAGFYGWSREQLRQMHIQEINTLSPAEVAAEMKRAKENKRVHFEFQHRLADGSVRDVEVFSSRIEIKGNNVLHSVIQDVTERKRIAAALRENEARLRTLINSMPDIVCFKDGQGRWLEANEFDLRLFQLENVDYRGKKDSELAEYSPFYREAFQTCEQSDEAAWQAGGISRGDEVIPRPDGPPLVFDIIKVPSFNEDGSRRGLIVVGRDITDRKRAEKEIRQSELMFSQFIEHSDFGINIIDEEGRVVEWNPAAEKISGMPKSAAVGRFLWDVMLQNRPSHGQTELGREKYKDLITKALRNGKPTFEGSVEKEICRMDGTYVIVQQIAFPIKTEKGYRFGSIIQDVTDRRAAERKIAESEERLRLLVQNSMDIITLMDERGIQTSVHGPLEKILGYREEDLVGTSGFDLVHPDDQASVVAIFAEGMLIPGSIRRAEYRYRHKDGHWVSLEAIGANLLHDPVVKSAVLNIRDITERVRAEEERRKLEEQLLQAMKMEAVGRLAGGVAHDFNNLLTSISGNVQLATMDLADDHPLIPTLTEVSKAADMATSLTRQLLAFSRKQLIEPQELNINRLIDNLQLMLTRLIGEDIELKIITDSVLGTVLIDPGQFEQILVNLAVNARDAMPAGGTLIVETANVDLDENYCQRHTNIQPGRYVRLTVSDTGCGMSDEVKRHLFEPFFTTKPIGHGTGLGLATIYGAIKQAGGNIEVYSEESVGTTFKIYLPSLAGREQTAAQKTAASSEMPAGDETIMLVEDDNLVRGLAHKVLSRLGYRVLVADHGLVALKLAEQYTDKIDLLLTDVVMPGMNGQQLAEKLLPIHPEMKVVFTSGYTEDAIVHHGVLNEGLHFIGKPYSPQSLAQKIRNVLDG